MMVTTRSKKEKLTVNDIELSDEEQISDFNNGEKSDKLIDYLPKFQDISWSINELISEQSKDPFCIEIINILKGKLQSSVRDLNSYIVYVLIDKILRRKRKILGKKDCNSNTTILNIVLPSTLLNKAITNVHFRHHTDRNVY